MHKSNELELGLERLEERKMLAGDISIDIDDGDVTIRGENRVDQDIFLTADENGVTAFSGSSTINGSNSHVLFLGDINNLKIDMRSGQSEIILRSGLGSEGAAIEVSGDLEIDTRSDNDLVYMYEVNVAGEVDINTRGGDDVIVFESVTFVADVDMRAGGGNDVFAAYGFSNNFGSSASDEFDVRMGGGNDGVLMTRVTAEAEVDVRTGGGEDRIASIQNFFRAEATINGNGRSDTFMEEIGVIFVNEVQLRSIEFEGNSTVQAELLYHEANNDTFSEFRAD